MYSVNNKHVINLYFLMTCISTNQLLFPILHFSSALGSTMFDCVTFDVTQ